MSFRIGHGYDSHRLEAGQGMRLGGVHIVCDYRIVAHSDGDVLIHALCDALLGACALGDIGKWFPDTDAKFSGADSRELLAEVLRAVKSAGYQLVNADLSLIAEAPKVAKFIEQMRAGLSELLEVDIGAVNVKATTAEGMNATGRKEGIEAHAVVLLSSSAA